MKEFKVEGRTIWVLMRGHGCFMIALLAVAIIMAPSPIDPKPYYFFAPPKLQGTLSQNQKLHAAKKLFEGILVGPESFAGDFNGVIYTGTSDGKIWRLHNLTARVIARTGINHSNCGSFDLEPECGRPKGIKLGADNDLYIADAYKGLLKVNTQTGHVKTLVQGINGKPFKFLNGLDIDQTGVVYFTDSSTKWDRRNHRYEVIETNNLGRLLEYNPLTQETKVLLSNLYLANGVAVSSCGTFLMIVEMSVCRILKYYIKGPKTGHSEVIHDNLPGYPDNIRLTSKGTFYIGMATVRFDGLSRTPPLLDMIGPYPVLKRFIAKVTPFWLYSLFVPKYGMLLEMDSNGKMINSFHDPDGSVVSAISEGYEYREELYLGHFSVPYVLKMNISHLYS